MSRIRLGKDIRIVWTITIAEGNVSVEDSDLCVEIKDPIGNISTVEHTISDGKVVIDLLGTSFKRYGDYWLTCWLNKGKQGQSLVDKRHAFKLVHSTEDEGSDSDDCCHITTETVEIEGEIEGGVPGKDGNDGKDGVDGTILYPTMRVDAAGYLIVDVPETGADNNLEIDDDGYLCMNVPEPEE